MHPEYIKALTRLMDLVDDGDLPKGAIPRIAYMGHTLVHSYENDNPKFKCVSCHTSGSGHDFACGCHKPEVYLTNHHQGARWRCRLCEHEWDGEEGHTCPDCQMIAPTTWVKVLQDDGTHKRGFIDGPSKKCPQHTAIRMDPNGENTEWEDMKDEPLAHCPNDWFDGTIITLSPIYDKPT